MTQHQQRVLRGLIQEYEKVKGVNALCKELLGVYDVYLLPPQNESLIPNKDHSLYFAKLDNKNKAQVPKLALMYTRGFGVYNQA